MPSKDESGIQQLNKMIYCFPSVSYDSYEGDRESTALIIKAKYGADAESTYYRVNVGTQGNVSKVDPNTKYLVTIRSVKGGGAPTPEEAYFATESQIVLSVVEGWDLEGNAFDMDEYGNFIVLSKGSLEFDGDDTDNIEVRVLTSKGLEWTAEYIAENEVSASAFNVVKLSNTALAISPKSENEEEEPLTGKCQVSATTEDGTILRVDIALRQDITEKEPYEPVIPSDMPFALIPESNERVKIDHENRTIEIDGFDPDGFNSFIDIPFKVYINENCEDKDDFLIQSDMEWPLEGGISTQTHEDHYYCANSFVKDASKGYKVYSKTKGTELSMRDAFGASNDINAKNGDTIYISVGAMAPDDPAIKRTVTLAIWGDKITYDLVVKPKPVIIDDVVLTDSNGNLWLIFDRNIQDKDADHVGRDSDGKKLQAYNFLYQYPQFSIPFKYKDSYSSSFDETLHGLYCGIYEEFKNKNNLLLKNTGGNDTKSISWLKSYIYSGSQERTSPFYEESDIAKWTFPTKELLQLCASKIRVSKMRLYLVSEVPVKSGKNKIPICCYWPFYDDFMNDTTFGYYFSESSGNPDSMLIICYDKAEIQTSVPSLLNKSTGLSRLVRPMTPEELNSYKLNYLGYGTQPHKLTICHPDTYESTPLGWIP